MKAGDLHETAKAILKEQETLYEHSIHTDTDPQFASPWNVICSMPLGCNPSPIRLARAGYSKAPSVTYGGKAWFYTRFADHGKHHNERFTVVWDRRDKRWILRYEVS